MSHDPHGRFVAWLLESGRGDPARDVAFHASVCPSCGVWIAAQDALTNIDVGRAPLPPLRPGVAPSSRRLRTATRRLVVTATLILVAAIVGFSAAQVISGRVGQGGGTEGGVLATGGSPGSREAPSASLGATSSP